MKTCSSAPASRSTRPHSAARCSRSTDSSWRAWPKVNSRNKVPIVDGAYTPSNRVFMPPLRTTSMSSILSAPAHMPATSGRQLRRRIGRPRLDPRHRDADLLVKQTPQAGLLGQSHHRHQPGARHEMILIEHRRIGCEPMGHLHRKCLSCAGRLLCKEHQSSQLRGHFPRYDTRRQLRPVSGSRLSTIPFS